MGVRRYKSDVHGFSLFTEPFGVVATRSYCLIPESIERFRRPLTHSKVSSRHKSKVHAFSYFTRNTLMILPSDRSLCHIGETHGCSVSPSRSQRFVTKERFRLDGTVSSQKGSPHIFSVDPSGGVSVCALISRSNESPKAPVRLVVGCLASQKPGTRLFSSHRYIAAWKMERLKAGGAARIVSGLSGDQRNAAPSEPHPSSNNAMYLSMAVWARWNRSWYCRDWLYGSSFPSVPDQPAEPSRRSRKSRCQPRRLRRCAAWSSSA